MIWYTCLFVTDSDVNFQRQIEKMKCPKCGIEGDGKFCQECGTKLIVKAKVVLCPGKDEDGISCNAELSSDQKFCKNCGTPVDPEWFGTGRCGECGAVCAKCGTAKAEGTCSRHYKVVLKS